jgi:hypothetical protein
VETDVKVKVKNKDLRAETDVKVKVRSKDLQQLLHENGRKSKSKKSELEVLNSFWALEFGGTILLKVIWVSRPQQTDR